MKRYAPGMHTVVLDGLHTWSVRWYEFWQFLGAIGTVAAVVVALGLARRDSKARARAEEQRDAALVAQKVAEATEVRRLREEQARLISVWAVPGEVGATMDDEGQITDEYPAVKIVVANLSSQPVFDCTFHHVVDGDDSEQAIPVDLVLEPSVRRDKMVNEHAERSSVSVTFRDASGTGWRRWVDGDLAEEP